MSPATLLAAAAGLAATAIVAALIAGLAARRARDRVRQTGKALEEARDQARRARNARDTFFDLTTHELRSPLAAILGYQELLAEGTYGDLPDGAGEAIERIGRSARHLVNLIDGVVEFSRLRSGTITPDLQSVHLGPILSGTADALRIHARDRRLEVEIDIDDQPGTLITDHDRLARALDLLITSAVRHPGEPHLSFHARRRDDTLDVRIDGTAIEPHRDDDDPVLRLGLRLAVAANIAHLLGGRLTTTESDGRIVALHFTARSRGRGFDGSGTPG